MTIKLSLWDRWRAAMRSFLHCVEEGYRRSTTPYIDQRLIWDGDDSDEVDPGSTSTQVREVEVGDVILIPKPEPVAVGYEGDGLMSE